MENMSQDYAVPNIDPSASASGTLVAVHADRQGNLIVMDKHENQAVAGKLFVANFGVLTAPLVTPVTTAIAAQRPQAWVRVPAETGIIPVRATIVVEANGITTQGEIAIAQSSNDVGNGTSAAATGPVVTNTRLGAENGNCVVRQLATADVTAETDLVELDRFSFAVSAVDLKFVYNPKADGLYSVLHGDASWLVYIGGNAVNFFAQLVWVEFDVNLIV